MKYVLMCGQSTSVEMGISAEWVEWGEGVGRHGSMCSQATVPSSRLCVGRAQNLVLMAC
jgi:hypothetical protein